MEETPRSGEASAELLWETILRVTTEIGSADAAALRILLYTVLRGGRPRILHDLPRCVRQLSRWLAVPAQGKAPDASKGCPLFAFFFNSAANMNSLVPVLRMAIKRSLHPNILVGDHVAVPPEARQGVTNYIGVRQLMAATTMRERLGALTRARKQYRDLVSGFNRADSSWAKTVRRNRTWIQTELTLLTAASHGLRRLYEAWEPSCVISTSDLWPFDHAVFAEARRCGVPSFVIQHGITNIFWWPFVADKLLVWGAPFANELRRLGAPAERLAVCGMPASDHLFSRYQQRRQRDCSKTASSYVILSDTHGRAFYPEVYPRFKDFLKTVLAATRSIHWSVKLHPLEDDRFYRELLNGRFPNLTILPKSTTLEEAVTRADVACTLWSTSGLEAMMMRRPLLVFDVAPIIHEYAWWPKGGGGIYVSTAESTVNFINKTAVDGQILDDLVARQNMFLDENFANAGRAAEAILDTIEETVKATSENVALRA
jgi:hypothetical protein